MKHVLRFFALVLSGRADHGLSQTGVSQMRISSLINTVENGLIAAAKATAGQARRIHHAATVELAANRIAEGHATALRLGSRSDVEVAEVDARAEELITKSASSYYVKREHLARRALAAKVIEGKTSKELIAAEIAMIESVYGHGAE